MLAPVERVWAIMGNLNQWNSFNSFLTVEDAPETLAPGQALRVSLQPPGHPRPTLVSPQVVDYAPGRELRWRGRLWNTDLFFVGEHFFKLQPIGPDKTLLVHGTCTRVPYVYVRGRVGLLECDGMLPGVRSVGFRGF
ncbi:hypothetical protein PLESTM_000298400 [Pleodorina starrii]|nr:hypothetical protein PLESTM_000298400 [Pleodorina starrii]